MPEWLPDMGDVGAISSVLGLIVTIFLFLEARQIRNSFLRRARLPEVCRDLSKLTSQLSGHLKGWNENKKPSLENFSKIKALLENIKEKLPGDEKKKVNECLMELSPRQSWFSRGSLSDLTEEEAWRRYTELTGLVMSLQQLIKDSKWD